MKKFKYYFKRIWYRIISKEYKVGWVLLPPQAVILNDETIFKITIDK
jgi:hypothetical protein